jgi:MFS family permease
LDHERIPTGRRVAVTHTVQQLGGGARRRVRATRHWALAALGGPGQARVVLILAAIIGLSEAATSTISATASNLERAFHIGNAEFGVVVSVAGLAAALCVLPFGVLADRYWRTRLLAISVALWAVAIVVAGAATSYLWLMLATVGLGIVTGAAIPSVASLTGDYFPAADRGRLYGLILGGQVVGAGLGLVISGDISAIASWRYAFWWLAVPSLALAWAVWRLPEPTRGGRSRPVAGGPVPGAVTLSGRASDAHLADGRDAAASGARSTGGAESGPDVNLAYEAARRVGAKPRSKLVLHSDPTRNSLSWAIGYVLRVRTNVIIILASSLGYFYFAGLRSFAVIYATEHYRISKPIATAVIAVVGVGAVIGVLAGGRVTDRMLRRGDIRARVMIPAVCLFIAPPVLALAIVTGSLLAAIPLLFVGALLLLAPEPPMDAARLDIMHPRLWGRSEAVRTVFLTAAESFAPTVFGVLSQYGFHGTGSANATTHSSANAAGLEYTFLVMLVLLFAAGLLALSALRSYPRDVATASASVEEIARSAGEVAEGSAGVATVDAADDAGGRTRRPARADPERDLDTDSKSEQDGGRAEPS